MRTNNWRITATWICATAALAATTGCSSWSYRHIELGQTPREYERALPEASRAQTEIGLCSLDRNDKRTEAIVLLLTPDRRVAGKLRAVVRRASGGLISFGISHYELIGSVSPEMYGTSGAGSTDTIRALLADLTDSAGPKIADDAHSLVAAGLLRLIWPDVDNPGVSQSKLEALLARVPAGGERTAEFGDDGFFHVAYSVDLEPKASD